MKKIKVIYNYYFANLCCIIHETSHMMMSLILCRFKQISIRLYVSKDEFGQVAEVNVKPSVTKKEKFLDVLIGIAPMIFFILFWGILITFSWAVLKIVILIPVIFLPSALPSKGDASMISKYFDNKKHVFLKIIYVLVKFNDWWFKHIAV